MKVQLLCLFLAAFIGTGGSAAIGQQSGDSASCLQCDRKLRKVFESMQAYRRSHEGNYPASLSDLVAAGFLPPDGHVCPAVLSELPRASATHTMHSSRKNGRDQADAYEYELTPDTPLLSKGALPWIPKGMNPSRKDLKRILLKRPKFDQIPVLRCASHRAEAPGRLANSDRIMRNLTVSGQVYWSGGYWETEWRDEVPYFARWQALFGLQGPPFTAGVPPDQSRFVDLRAHVNAVGNAAWWWDMYYYGDGKNMQRAPGLEKLFQGKAGRTAKIGPRTYWLDGLIQLQGAKGKDLLKSFKQDVFPDSRQRISIKKNVTQATWLQGTVWEAPPKEIAGWLVWHYEDGESPERVAILYGTNTERFWSESPNDQASPVWSAEDRAPGGRRRKIRLFSQTWNNPTPLRPVAYIDFVSNLESPAAPFLVSISLH